MEIKKQPPITANRAAAIFSTLLCLVSLIACGARETNYTTDYSSWSDYGGSADAAQYSSLDQISRSNVSRLEVAWSYPTGDNNRYFFGPLVVDNVAYVLAKNNSIVAIDATNGKEIWAHLPALGTVAITNRGINYWERADRSEGRLLYAADHYLRALDARTGELIQSFGKDGKVNLKEGLGRDPESLSLMKSTISERGQVTAPKRIRHDLGLQPGHRDQCPADLQTITMTRSIWSSETQFSGHETGFPSSLFQTINLLSEGVETGVNART